MENSPIKRSFAPQPLPRFVELTQTNARKTFVQLHLIDESSIEEYGFSGARLLLKTSNHPTVAFNGDLTVFESPEKVRELLDGGITTHRHIKIKDFVTGREKDIKADEIDIVQMIERADNPVTNLYMRGQPFVQSMDNPFKNPENILQPAAILPFAPRPTHSGF